MSAGSSTAPGQAITSGASCCRVCMDARGEQTWCGQCNAVELWAENVTAALLYLSVETQYRHAGMTGIPTGLDYAGVRAAMDLQAIPETQRPNLFEDIRSLERTYLEVAHARIAKEQVKQAAKPGQVSNRPGR